jgi:hypothetical protein
MEIQQIADDDLGAETAERLSSLVLAAHHSTHCLALFQQQLGDSPPNRANATRCAGDQYWSFHESSFHLLNAGDQRVPFNSSIGMHGGVVGDPLQRPGLKLQIEFRLGVRCAAELGAVVDRVGTSGCQCFLEGDLRWKRSV